MPSSKDSKLPLFPPGFWHTLGNRVKELYGLSLASLALWGAFALATYTPSDVSWNTATTASVQNFLGESGAFFADGAKQLLGDMSWLFLLSVFIFGFKILRHVPRVFPPSKALGFFLSLILFCLFYQSFFLKQTLSPTLPAPLPRGGVLGFFLTQKIYKLFLDHHIRSFFSLFRFLTFWMALFLWKNSLSTTFREMYLYGRTFFMEMGKMMRLLKFRKKVPFFSMDSPFRVPEESFLSEDLEDFHKVPPLAEKKEATPHVSRLSTEGGVHYHFPSVNLLSLVKENPQEANVSREKISESAQQLLDVLSEFGVNGTILGIQPGPVVTQYEFRPAPGIKTSRIISLSDDIARSMSALSARIANIPGKNAIGIELPNEKRKIVYLRSLLTTQEYHSSSGALPLILGKDISGNPVIADLAKMPHLLVAGTTGSGKSVSINTMILSLLYKFSPKECRFIMVDPKMLELSVYDDIPHLLTPVVTDPKKAIFALKWAVREMEARYKAMSRMGVRNIDGFNQKIREGQKNGDMFKRRVQTGFDSETGKPLFEDQSLEYEVLSYIVVVVDEMADLMMVAGKEIEAAVQRLAQMARAAGIHLIMATQRPSVDVITGTIKANFPTRVSFQVTSKIDSRTILGEQGAEQLLGHGDMLYMSGGGRIQRVHGPFVSDSDVEAITAYLRTQGEPDYVDGITDEQDESLFEKESDSGDSENLFQDAVDLLRREGRVSISFIQRNFQIGYNKAAKLVEQMEKKGIVSPPDRTGKRELL